MSKILRAFLLIIIFVLGLSIGVYSSFSKESKEEEKPLQTIDSVQDVVIHRVQEERNEDEEKQVEVFSTEERISPYATMVIEKKYTKCGHTTVSRIEVPKELVNLSEEELKEKYSGWTIKSFSPEEFTLFRYIEANCEDHFVLKEKDGYLAVYNDLTEEMKNLVLKTDILIEDLREEDKYDLEEGIQVYGEENIQRRIEELL